jgi:hypothetical protein
MPFPPGEDAATQLVSVPLRYWRVMGAGGGSAYDQLARGAAGDSAVVRVGASETRTKPVSGPSPRVWYLAYGSCRR